jgi:hypothetical protein
MTLSLSQHNLLLSYFFHNSSINLSNQIISLLASVAATYSAFVVESSRTFCSFEIQLTDVPPRIKTYLVVLLLLSLSPSIYESTYPCRTMFEPPKHNALVVVPLKYLKINFTSSQCYLPRLFIYLLTTPLAYAIFDLVQTIAYIKLPTTQIMVMVNHSQA